MQKLASALSDDFEYAFVVWGQSNANPRGSLTDGFAAAPHLEFEDSGADLTVSVVGTSSTVACVAGVGADQWVGAELRMGSVSESTLSSITFPTTDTVTKVAHGLSTGQPLYFAGTVAPTGGLTFGSVYYASYVDADNFTIHTTLAAAIAGTPDVAITASSGTGPFSAVLIPQRKGYGTVTACTGTSNSVVTFPTADTVTWAAHGLTTGCPILFTGTVAPTGGMVLGDIYYVAVASSSTFALHPTFADAIAGTSALSITANSGTGPFVGYAGSTLTVTWADTPTTAASTAAHVCFRDDRHKSYAEVRVLTPFQPDQAGDYPTTDPAMPGYTVAATITNETLGAFLPLTFKEGVASFGQCETDGLISSANATSCTMVGTILLASGYAGGYLRVRHAGGVSWADVTDNTNQVFSFTAWEGDGTPSGTASAWTWEAWLPHGDNNPSHLTPGPGWLYPNNAHQPAGAVLNRPRNNTTAVYGERFGAMIPFAWRMSQKLGKRVNIIYLAAHGSSIMRTLSMFGGPTTVGWWSTAIHLDWSSGNLDNVATRLWTLINRVAAPALVAEGNTKTLRILGILGFQGETEAGNAVGRELYETLLPRFYTWLRTAIDGAGMNPYGDDAKIPVVHASLPAYPWGSEGVDTEDVVNTAITKFTALDGFAATFSTDDSPQQTLDPLHFDGEGEALNGELAADAMGTLLELALSVTEKLDQVTVCNLALSYLGESPISSLDPAVDSSLTAALCARFYTTARNELLGRRPWTFATRRKTLTAVASDWSQWEYAYGVPADCLRPQAVYVTDSDDDYALVATDWLTPSDVQSSPTQLPKVVFTIEQDEDGNRVLYTDLQDASLRYTAKVCDVSLWPAWFTKALAWLLASDLAGALIKGDKGADQAVNCIRIAEAILAKAGEPEGTQRSIRMTHNPRSITGR